MGKCFEALYSHGEKSDALVREIDQMQKDFNEAMDECREATDMLQEVIQQDMEGRVRNIEGLENHFNFT